MSTHRSSSSDGRDPAQHSVPMQATAVETPRLQSSRSQASQAQSVPLQSVPLQSAPVQSVPAQSVPAQSVPVQSAPMQSPEPHPTPFQLYLASQSPRRLELLAQLGLSPAVIVADIDETPRPHETPEAYVTRIAAAKAQAGWARLPETPTVPLLAADTAVVIDGRPLGKPADAEAALSMLALLSERTHEVLTAVTVLAVGPDRGGPPRQCQRLSRTEVQMRQITRGEALSYWESGEPRDKAGAYAIQGRGAVFVESLRGSYSNVVGLPLYETAVLLREQGIEILGLSGSAD